MNACLLSSWLPSIGPLWCTELSAKLPVIPYLNLKAISLDLLGSVIIEDPYFDKLLFYESVFFF